MKGIILLLVYGTVMLVATHIFARKGEDSEDFHVGNRRMGVGSTAMSVAATWIWAPARQDEALALCLSRYTNSRR